MAVQLPILLLGLSAVQAALPPALGASWPIPQAFGFYSHFIFNDPSNQTAKDIVAAVISADVESRFQIEEPGNILLDCSLEMDADGKGYQGWEIYRDAAAWFAHKANSNFTQLGVITSLVTQVKGHMVGPKDTIDAMLDDIKSFNFTYEYAPIPADAVGPGRFGFYEHGAEYPVSAIALVAHSKFKNASCEAPAMAINRNTVQEHIYQYQERGFALLSYNCTWVKGGYSWIEIYNNQAAYNLHAKHSNMTEVLQLLTYASLDSLDMYGPKGSGWPYPAYGISDAIAATVSQYGGHVHYGSVPEGLVGTGRFGVFNER